VLEKNASNANRLIESGVFPQQNDFFWASRISGETYGKIAELGFSFEHQTPNSNGIVEFAAKACNANLIDELYVRKLPYTLGSNGKDALAHVLTSIACRRNTSQRISTVSALMKFKPIISDVHKQYLAHLRLMEYENYRELIDQFPELKVGDDARAKRAACY
jgi:hypothetical protein